MPHRAPEATGSPNTYVPDGAATAPGWLVPVRDPAALLARLDGYEGPEYRRIRVSAREDDGADGTVCWTYAWAAGEGGLTPLPRGWPPSQLETPVTDPAP
jgi:hypothetical protein